MSSHDPFPRREPDRFRLRELAAKRSARPGGEGVPSEFGGLMVDMLDVIAEKLNACAEALEFPAQHAAA
jgi:hypothetical protein